MFFIFRKSDGTLLYTPHTEKQLKNERATCLTNEGGTADDYIILEGDVPTSTPDGIRMSPILKNGQLAFEPDPTVVARAELRASGRAKLVALGLTEDEIAAL